ncbi:MAG: hypothetical protein ABUS79_30770, partial [Pseudomonadota bacterium]
LARVTRLLAIEGKSGASSIWAGTTDGLFRLEGARFGAVTGTTGAVVTSLDADPDGMTVWAGLRGRGLVHVDARHVIAEYGPRGTGTSLDFTLAVGIATLPNGTRVAAGRGADGGARILLLQLAGPTLLDAQPDLSVTALVAGPHGPLLVARDSAVRVVGAPGVAAPARGLTGRTFTLSVATRGQPVAPGVVRFSPVRRNLDAMRLLASPVQPVVGDVTAAIAVDDGEVFPGTRGAGVMRVTERRADFLPTGELALGAKGLSIACVDRERCLVTTGNGRLYRWSGATQDLTLITPQGAAGETQVLVGDGSGPVYGIFRDPQKRGFRLSRLGADWAHWDPLLQIPVAGEGTAVATRAWLNPRGDLWIAVRDRAPSGEERGRGVLEVQMPDGKVVYHRPYSQGEPRSPEALPVSGDVRAVRFVKSAAAGDAPAIWFCTDVGVSRFAGGAFQTWTENDGLEDERCRDLGADDRGVVWMASGAGMTRFDGQAWRPGGFAKAWPVDRDGDDVEASSVAIWSGTLWAGTGRGLIAAGRSEIRDRAAGLIDDDIRDLVPDRFGRLWLRGTLGISLLAPSTTSPSPH